MVTPIDNWVFLAYRLPREPSAPRLALWRALRRLGGHLVSDGLVTLPHSARNLEQLEWLGTGVVEDGGAASVWLAKPMTPGTSAAFMKAMRDAVDEEYQSVMREARELVAAPGADRRRAMRRLRGELRRIGSRDYFAAEAGKAARAEVERLAATAKAPA